MTTQKEAFEKKNKKRFSDIAIRILSALSLMPIALFCVYFGGLFFIVLATVLIMAMAREWTRMSDEKANLVAYLIAIAGGGISVLLVANGLWGAGWIVLILAAVVSSLERRARGSLWRAAFGIFYIGIPTFALVYLRLSKDGVALLLFLFAVVWAADSAAYLVGSAVRGPRLWPAISPNKTWSGFIGGLIAGGGTGAVFALYTGQGLFAALSLALLLALVAMGGDLFSSAIKRRFGVKDTGTSIPGHGGVLDRLDALLAAGTVLAGLLIFFPAVWG